MREFPVLWQAACGLFFVYVIAIALLRRHARRRRLALVAASLGLIATAGSVVTPRIAWLHDWLLPPALLLVGYWSSGALFTVPMAKAEAILLGTDRAFGISNVRIRRPAAEFLETSYASVYLVVGLAFLANLAFVPSPNTDRFWAVVLITDFLCFATLPWIQTRPPRTLEARAPWSSSVRRFNLRLLDGASIHANTFPSGHAAEACAAALLVAGAPLPVVLLMWCFAVAITAGAVFGRYHFALDALGGWLVAIGVWLLVT
jgi:membrane-associated phospholipid phosphatase